MFDFIYLEIFEAKFVDGKGEVLVELFFFFRLEEGMKKIGEGTMRGEKMYIYLHENDQHLPMCLPLNSLTHSSLPLN